MTLGPIWKGVSPQLRVGCVLREGVGCRTPAQCCHLSEFENPAEDVAEGGTGSASRDLRHRAPPPTGPQ